jgi:hypothetical protein
MVRQRPGKGHSFRGTRCRPWRCESVTSNLWDSFDRAADRNCSFRRSPLLRSFSPRHDGKVALRFIDLDNFSHEWVLDDLPWDAVTSIGVGNPHPDTLDQRLVDAIQQRGLPLT